LLLLLLFIASVLRPRFRRFPRSIFPINDDDVAE